jgi:hypothetical protein
VESQIGMKSGGLHSYANELVGLASHELEEGFAVALRLRYLLLVQNVHAHGLLGLLVHRVEEHPHAAVAAAACVDMAMGCSLNSFQKRE